VTFVNIIGDDATAIACLVDVSTRKTGKFAAGTALQIVVPEDLKRLKPDLIIVANPIYTDEIRKIVNALDLDPAFESISG
jgi:hypothetical protein